MKNSEEQKLDHSHRAKTFDVNSFTFALRVMCFGLVFVLVLTFLLASAQLCIPTVTKSKLIYCNL